MIDADGRVPAYAFFRELGALSRGRTFDRLADLAAHIHQMRAGRALELAEARLAFQERVYDGVSIWTRSDEGLRETFLGYAWLRGCGRPTLEAALDAAGSTRPGATRVDRRGDDLVAS